MKLLAVVSVQGIEDMWGVVTTLLQQMGRPKIMVFVREKIGEDVQDDSTVQTRIENLLLKSGFLLVDKEQLKEIDKKDLQAAAAEDSPARIQAIAKRFGAQLFITGTANSHAGPAKNVSGVELFPIRPESNIRCYRSDTAQLLSSIPGCPDARRGPRLAVGRHQGPGRPGPAGRPQGAGGHPAASGRTSWPGGARCSCTWKG